MESVINVENFYFAYKKSDLVLRDINFEIKKGSFTVITGPSGAGKTTLCKAMTGIVPYYMGGRYSGDVKINGESTKGKRVSDIAMRVGFIMEDYESQLVSLTAGEEIAFSLLNHGFAPQEVENAAAQAKEMGHVRVRGLMTIPPADATREENVVYFQKVQALYVDINRKMYDNGLEYLSMGMSGDFADAIRAGANMVRVGTAIFGARDYSK